MPPLLKPFSSDASDTASVEERMRRALGLTGAPAGRAAQPQPEQPRLPSPGRPPARTSATRPRHRFVPDGAVPVTVVNRHRSDHADAPSAGHGTIEAALRDEHAARERAERSLQEALATVHDLQTKLGHAELARREASGSVVHGSASELWKALEQFELFSITVSNRGKTPGLTAF